MDGASEGFSRFIRDAGFEPADIVDTFEFGDEPELMDRLAELVVNGPKRATTSLYRWYESKGERLPAVGELTLVVGSARRPRAIIRVTAVDLKPFAAVDAQDAWDEGEGDRSLAYWRDVHEPFFTAETVRESRPFDQAEPVVFCRFALVWAPEQPLGDQEGCVGQKPFVSASAGTSLDVTQIRGVRREFDSKKSEPGSE